MNLARMIECCGSVTFLRLHLPLPPWHTYTSSTIPCGLLTLSADRTGRTAFIAGWYLGAYMKAIPDSARQVLIPSGPRSMATPRA